MLKKTTLAMAIIASGIGFTGPVNAETNCYFCTCIWADNITTSCIATPPNQGSSLSPLTYTNYTEDSCKSYCKDHYKTSNNYSCGWTPFTC